MDSVTSQIPLLVFIVIGTIAVASSILVVAMRNPVHSALFLLLTFLCVAVLFVIKSAEFVAAVQVLVYAGGIMVLFLFVVMLLNAPKEDATEWDQAHPLRHPIVTRVGTALALLLVVEIAWSLMRNSDLDAAVGSRSDASVVGSVAELGRVLFQRHGFAFEATSVLILVAMVGAVVMARREGEE
jgi:NADH-quinone oxidoreductase subunit J